MKMKYTEISLLLLNKIINKLPFNIFIQRAEGQFTLMFKVNDPIDPQRLENYKSKGVKVFFIDSNDYSRYSTLIESLSNQQNGAEQISKLTSQEALELVKELTVISMIEISKKHKISQQSVKNAEAAVGGAVKAVTKCSNSALVKVISLMANHPYFIKHSITTSIFSVMLAQRHGIDSKRTLEMIGLGAFIHDIGIGQLTFDPEEQEQLTPDQRKELWMHPELGVQQVDSMKGVGNGVLQIMMQHHEQPNGHGYPNHLKTNQIFLPAKIVAIADSFCSLITDRSFRKAHSAIDAISIMNKSPGKYDSALLSTFSSIFLPS